MIESETGKNVAEHSLSVLYSRKRGIDCCVNVAMVNKVGVLCSWQTRTAIFQMTNAILTSYLKE